MFNYIFHIIIGVKAVGESVKLPLLYYQNNFTGTINLLKIMEICECKKIIFSSSATVYGDSKIMPLTEDLPTQSTNPYGRTKLFIEEMLRDVCIAEKSFSCVLLRYFNPAGAHPSGIIGEFAKVFILFLNLYKLLLSKTFFFNFFSLGNS